MVGTWREKEKRKKARAKPWERKRIFHINGGKLGTYVLMKVGQELTLTWRVPCREILYVTFRAKRSPTTMVMSLARPHSHWLLRGHMTSKNESVSRQNPWAGIRATIESLRLRVFNISREPRTSISHVTRALPSGLRFEVYVCAARPRSRGKWFTARFFCTPRQHNPTFEKKYNFLELFCLLVIEFYFKKRNFEDNFSAKIEVNEWKQTW